MKRTDNMTLDRGRQKSDFLMAALKKMFSSQGLEYPCRELTQHKDWFARKTWTEEQQNAYKEWFIKKTKALRMPKREASTEASMFLLLWGWRVDNESPTSIKDWRP